MVELAAIDERLGDKERSMLKDVLKQLQKERRKTRLVRLWKKCNTIWRKRTPEPLKLNGFFRVLGEYILTWDKELERPHCVMDKMWQMMQSNETKTMTRARTSKIW